MVGEPRVATCISMQVCIQFFPRKDIYPLERVKHTGVFVEIHCDEVGACVGA